MGALPWIMGGQALINLWQGRNQDQAARRNYQGDMAKYQQMQKLLFPFMQQLQGANPYQRRLSQLLGLNSPSGFNVGSPMQMPGAGPTNNVVGGQPGQPWYLGGTSQGGGNPWWDPAGTGTKSSSPNSGSGGPASSGGSPAGGVPMYSLSVPEFFGGNPMNSVAGPPTGGPVYDPMQWGTGGDDLPGGGWLGDNYQPDPINGTPWNGEGVNSLSYNPSTIDSSLFGDRGEGMGAMNASQDALMQYLRRDPSGQMAEGLVNASNDLFNMNTDRSADLLRGRARGLGQFGGTAAANSEALFRSQAGAEQGVNAANIRNQASQFGVTSMLNAAGQLGQLGMSQGQLGSAGRDQMLRAMLSNMDARNQASQFGINSTMQGLQMGNSMDSQRMAMMLQSMGLLGGMGTPQSPVAGAGVAGGLGDAANMAMFYPFLRDALKPNASSAYGGPTSYTPTYNPGNYGQYGGGLFGGGW